ncbi:MAG TPA: alpha/beta fold hydrolase [Solirubrobacteraceae bacterium]|nr:alpha/beta fold hydrolase [Solirubrobacteraceae bacterium]
MSNPLHTERVVPFTSADGVECNVINVRGASPPAKPPVLLVHGAGVRANIFRAPSRRTLVDALVDAGHDVWLENWRASIDIPHNRWTLDQAAVFDHPAAVRTVLDETGADELRAVIHCQGSTSFMMAAVAGALPEVKTIVSNAVSLHPVVARLSQLKLRYLIPAVSRVLGYLNPQWGLTGAPGVAPKAVAAWVKLTHRECDNDVCKLASYTYGTGKPTLWRHENLNPATHDWLKHEFADVPLTFFRQILRCVEAGRLLSVEGRPELPADFTAQPAQTDARFVFLAGERNVCFLPVSQQRTYEWFDRQAPGRHGLHILPGYGHLDVFMGADAASHVFPTIIEELER